MNKKLGVAALPLTLAVALTTACTPTSESVTPPSSTASPFDAREVKRAEAKVSQRELGMYGALSIPSTVDRIAAEDAARQALPYVFTYRTGCTWLRTWDAKLWSLHTGGGALNRGVDDEQWFRSNPGASSDSTCYQTGSVPTADDATATTPYRWRAGDRDLVRVQGAVFVIPSAIPERGVALRPANQN